jgi:hypothetical protein
MKVAFIGLSYLKNVVFSLKDTIEKIKGIHQILGMLLPQRALGKAYKLDY